MAPWLLGLALCSTIGGGPLRAEGMPDPSPGVACLGTLYVGQIPGLPGARLQLVRQGERLRGHALYPPVAPAAPAGGHGEERRREIDGKAEADGHFVLTETDPYADGAPVTGRFAGAFDAAGIAAGQWESAAGDRRLAFVLTPTDRAGTADSPAFGLSCRPDADGTEQLYLVIPGRTPVLLNGEDEDGESLRSDGVQFDPSDLSVRSLPGSPSLLWLRYHYTRMHEVGSAEVAHRRDLVVQADDTSRRLFDHWSGMSYTARSPYSYRASADSTVVYAAGTLKVVTSIRHEKDWFDDDWMTYIGEQDCGGDTAPEAQGPAHEECVRKRLRALYADANHEASLTRKTLDIDATTGASRSSGRVWAKAYSPVVHGLALLSGETRLSLLVLDDGIVGWLILLKEPPDFSPEGAFDPAEPTALPALASCWLYNRSGPSPANASRPYPPALAAGTRPVQTVPEACCAVETSTDGRWIGIHESLSAEESDKPGRLLALYDTETRQCWSANLAEDGPLGRAPYDRMSDPVFSPDGRRVGFRAQRGEARFVVVDDQAGPSFHRVSPPVFSPDSRQVAYWARDKGKEFAVLDGKRGPAFDGAGLPVFRPDGRLVYRVREGARWRVMEGDAPGLPFDDIGWFRVDSTGRANDIADLVLSARGELAYAARRGTDWFIVRDLKPGESYQHVGLPVYSPDGKRLAFRARRDDRERIVLDGRPGPVFDFVGTPVFRPDGQTIAYWAREGDQQFVMWGEHWGPAFAAPGRAGAPVFADDGRGPFYWGQRAGWRDQDHWRSEVIMQGDRAVAESESLDGTLNRQTGEVSTKPSGRARDPQAAPFDEVGSPVQSPAGDRIAYRARVGEVWLPIVEPVAAEAPDQGTGPTGQPPAATAPLSGTPRVPQLLPHPFAIGSRPFGIGGWIVGGSARGRWIDTDGIYFDSHDSCLPLGAESIDPGPPWRLYAFDRPLGECRTQAPVACMEVAYARLMGPEFSGCKVKDYLFAVAGDWNALPRRPRVIKDLGGFEAPVRSVLTGQGRDAATVTIRWAHAIDLDGDGKEERVVHARVRSREAPSEDVPRCEHDDEDEYPLLLLLGPAGGKEEARVVYAWWPGDASHCYRVRDAFYADANGDGSMEIFLPRLGEEMDALRVYALEAGRPVATPIRFDAP